VEKARVYAPIRRKGGIAWKELNVGINKVMQSFCGDPRHERLLNMGLVMLDDLKDVVNSDIYARDPHDLGRLLGVVDILTAAEMIIHSSLARKASSVYLHFNRLDYPEKDPAEWQKFVTIKQEDGNVKEGELPFGYWGDFRENYEKHRPK